MSKRTGRPKSKNPMRQTIRARVTQAEFNRIQILADLYAGGELSKWIRHAALNAPRRVLK